MYIRNPESVSICATFNTFMHTKWHMLVCLTVSHSARNLFGAESNLKFRHCTQTFNWNIQNTKCSQQATTISKFANRSVKWRRESEKGVRNVSCK